VYFIPGPTCILAHYRPWCSIVSVYFIPRPTCILAHYRPWSSIVLVYLHILLTDIDICELGVHLTINSNSNSLLWLKVPTGDIVVFRNDLFGTPAKRAAIAYLKLATMQYFMWFSHWLYFYERNVSFVILTQDFDWRLRVISDRQRWCGENGNCVWSQRQSRVQGKQTSKNSSTKST